MGIIIKDRNPLISFILTDYGKKQLSLGQLSFDFYAFGDSDVDYRTADINSLTLKPTTDLSDLKYLLFKKNNNCFYSMGEQNFESESVVDNQTHTYNTFYNDNKIITIDNKFIGVEGSVITVETPYIIKVKFKNSVNEGDIKPLDFITLYFGNELKYSEDVAFNIIHAQVENITIKGDTAQIFLKQPLNQNLDSYKFFITSSNFLFLNDESWNQIFCGGEQLSNIEKRFDGVRSYFDVQDSLLIYQNIPINSKDFTEVSTNTANLYLPTIMWDKTPVNKMGLNLHTDDNVSGIMSPVNVMSQITTVGLIDAYNNRVGYYLPQNKMFLIDDIELATTMANKNGRNWTLPGIEFEYTPSNGNGIFNKTNDDLYVTYRLKGGIHDNTGYCRKILYVQNRKGDFQLNLDFTNFTLPSINIASRRVKEISILFQFVSPDGMINPNNWQEITMLKGENLTIDNIRGKYGFNMQHLTRGDKYENNKPNNLDEQLFLGNVQYVSETKRYKTTFKFINEPNMSLHTSNPTYNAGQDVRVSEVAVYDKKYKPVAYAKVSHTIRWRPDIAFTIKTQMIF